MHLIHDYLQKPLHPVSVLLVGLGGTGSHMVAKLAQIHATLTQLNHPGLQIDLQDPDVVEPFNVGRQCFVLPDIGRPKAEVLGERLARYHGIPCRAILTRFEVKKGQIPEKLPNILLTCADNNKVRIDAQKLFRSSMKRHNEDKCYYWLDCGNDKSTGQVVMGSKADLGEAGPALPTIMELYQEEMLATEAKTKDEPSCSAFESLQKQDLFINAAMAQAAGQLLWRLFRKEYLYSHGCFVNVETDKVLPIPVPKIALPY